MNNEFAFPRIVPEGDTLQPGMTLRQLYAGIALGACINEFGGSLFGGDDNIPKYAVEYADKLILELSKTQNNER